jgi:hypothetical protein
LPEPDVAAVAVVSNLATLNKMTNKVKTRLRSNVVGVLNEAEAVVEGKVVVAIKTPTLNPKTKTKPPMPTAGT